MARIKKRLYLDEENLKKCEKILGPCWNQRGFLGEFVNRLMEKYIQDHENKSE